MAVGRAAPVFLLFKLVIKSSISLIMSGSRPFLRPLGKPHPQFGFLKGDMPKDQLPTRGNIAQRILALRAEEIRSREVPEFCVAVTPLIEQVTNECMKLWEDASLPTLARFRVREKKSLRCGTVRRMPESRSDGMLARSRTKKTQWT